MCPTVVIQPLHKSKQNLLKYDRATWNWLLLSRLSGLGWLALYMKGSRVNDFETQVNNLFYMRAFIDKKKE